MGAGAERLKSLVLKNYKKYFFNLYEIKVTLMDDNFFWGTNFHFATSDQTFGKLIDKVGINLQWQI